MQQKQAISKVTSSKLHGRKQRVFVTSKFSVTQLVKDGLKSQNLTFQFETYMHFKLTPQQWDI
jgi:hypothetical protein